MAARLTGFHMDLVVGDIDPRRRGGRMMFVGGEAMMMFGMIVIHVRVDVQRGSDRGRSQREAEHDCHRSMHEHESMEATAQGQLRARRPS